MSKVVKLFVENSPKYAMCKFPLCCIYAVKGIYRFSAEKIKPVSTKFMQYARVEMRPPNKHEITLAVNEGKSLVAYLRSGAILQKKIKDVALDSVVAIEVLMWFFIGEIIGRRSLIGYKHVKGAYIVAH
ncbi:unnamed protein product [Dibothriocephalus latus]|uniref:Uncharacterized protein n=1 Tax=Dibothriocephalus latus TaxID=60516 RepID=A0A3P6PFM9_DIBLA|nr:unnamed protein product [Dibothriocephalus latus]